MLRFFLFGQFTLLYGQTPYKLPSRPKTRALLAYLLLYRERAIPRDTTAFALWPDETEKAARANLRRHLYSLQQALPPAQHPWLATDAQTIRWHEDATFWLDVAVFEDHSRHDDTLHQTIPLYGGDLLEDMDEDWLFYDRERLREMYLANLARLVDRQQALGERVSAAAYAQQLLLADPFREDIVRQLMLMLHTSANRSGALAVYENFARRLRSEIGVTPMPETVLLYERLVRNEPLMGDARSAPPGKRLLTLPFVGRDREMTDLHAVWTRVAHSHSKLVMIGGEAGVGKSRLAAELADRIEKQGARVLIGHTSPTESRVYEAITSALQSILPLIAVQPVDPVWLSVLLPLLPDLQQYLPDLKAPAPIDPQREQARLFEALTVCLRSVAQSAPVLLVLEDLHWSNPATVYLLAHLVDHLADAAVLVLVTYRPEEVTRHHPLYELRRNLRREERVVSLALKSLHVKAVHNLMEQLSPQASSASDLADFLYTRSEGCPLFMDELLRDWMESGKVVLNAEQLHIRDADLMSLPSGVQAVITARLERLSERARAFAELAAVMGTTVDVDLVREVSGWQEADILDSLNELQDHHLLCETHTRGAFDYRFTHHLIQSVIYAQMSPASRTRRHYRMAQVMADIDAYQGDSVAQRLAEHYEHAGQPAAAAPHYLRAARHALTVYAYHEVVKLVEHTLTLTDDTTLHFEALALRDIAAHRQGQHDLQRTTLDAMMKLAEQMRDNDRITEVLRRRIDMCHRQGDYPYMAASIDRLKEHARTSGSGIAHRLAMLGEINHAANQNAYERAIELANQALVICRQSGDVKRELECHHMLAWTAVQQGRFEDAAAHITDIQNHNHDVDVPLQIRSLSIAASAAHMSQNYPMSLHFCQKLLDLSLRVGDRNGEANAHAYLSMTRARLFDIVPAQEHARQAVALYRSMGNRVYEAAVNLNVATFIAALGLMDQAKSMMEQARAIFQSLNDMRGLALSAINLSLLYQLIEDFAAGEAEARLAVTLARQINNGHLEANALANLASALLWQDKPHEAIPLLNQVLDMRRHQGGQETSISEELRDLALAYLKAGDLDQARSTVEDVLALQAKFDYTLTREQFNLWTAALVYRACGEQKRSRQMLQQALERVQSLAKSIPDDATRSAFLDMSYNRYILDAYHRDIWPD